MWKDLYNKLEIDHPAGKRLPLSDDNVLDQAEGSLGCRLPQSYREFCKVFGAGELGGYYRVAIPLPFEHDFELLRFNVNAHGEEDDCLWEGYFPDDDMIKRVVFFAETIGGEMFAWDTDNLQDSAMNEYAIYFFHRKPRCEVVARSFSEFVASVCLKQREVDGELWPPQQFSPFEA